MADESDRHVVAQIYTDGDMPAHFAGEAEAAEFWETHELTAEDIRTHRLPGGRSPLARLDGRRKARQSPAAAQQTE